MAEPNLRLENRALTMEGDYSAPDLFVKNAEVTEGLSMLTETKIEFVTKDKTLALEKIVGSRITLKHKTPEEENERTFTGRCISAEYIGLSQGMGHFMAEVRPFFWFLTRGRNNRIFQKKTTPEIVKEVIGDHGFGSDIDDQLSETYVKREYCVQYRESDYDFLCRLMAEEGIYFFFIEVDNKEKMVLADSISAHKKVPMKEDGATDGEIKFKYREMEGYRRDQDHIMDWNAVERATPGKVTIDDYDFSRPTAELKQAKSIEKGTHSHKHHEIYEMGHLRDNVMDSPQDHDMGEIDNQAERRTRVRMEAEAAKFQRWRGMTNVRDMGVGQTFKLLDHPRVNDEKEFLIIKAFHQLQIETDYEDDETKNQMLDDRAEVDDENQDSFRCKFEVMPKNEPFRSADPPPWPTIAGVHTAIVTGPSGDEIYTDEHGRIKVKFHWDRGEEQNENTTCWVRCVMPWSGKNWGMISIPRIGQEVVIQFEEGDPDRPICTGMVYNADTMPPYELPANMTQTGIVTRSTPGGNEDTFNELIFEDKIEEEFVRLQSEKDYKETIKNNAEITIGIEKQDPGDLTQTIYHTKTETIQTGDHIFKVEEGNQEVFVKTNHAETIEGTADQTITGDTSQTITQGNLTRNVDSGNEAVTISMGDYSLDTSLGSVAITAAQEISLTVGSSSITITQSGITIEGPTITISGTAMLEAKAPTSTVKGDMLLTLKGGMTMIN